MTPRLNDIATNTRPVSTTPAPPTVTKKVVPLIQSVYIEPEHPHVSTLADAHRVPARERLRDRSSARTPLRTHAPNDGVVRRFGHADRHVAGGKSSATRVSFGPALEPPER
jgi:hypothetical protein